MLTLFSRSVSHQQNILSFVAFHIFLEVLNPCFQPEHTVRIRGTLNTGQGTSSVHPFPIGWGEEARQVISQRYNPVPPILIGWGETRREREIG